MFLIFHNRINWIVIFILRAGWAIGSLIDRVLFLLVDEAAGGSIKRLRDGRQRGRRCISATLGLSPFRASRRGLASSARSCFRYPVASLPMRSCGPGSPHGRWCRDGVSATGSIHAGRTFKFESTAFFASTSHQYVKIGRFEAKDKPLDCGRRPRIAAMLASITRYPTPVAAFQNPRGHSRWF